MASSDAPPYFPGVHRSKWSREDLRMGQRRFARDLGRRAGAWSGRTNKSERGPLVGEGHGKINKPRDAMAAR